ncbi:MAG: ADP-ribosylglycohydrolase family protein [Planctomycetes bacterium]|nr:ADP-ribosylglycohydrolase family protein [Planctomycetota bacterium]
MPSEERLAGCLLGTALGDALGLPCEGMSAKRIARRFGRMDRFRLLGATGYVSDDTEQSALVAQALARHPGDLDAATRAFRRSLLGWFLRGPWGIGFATLRACLRIASGLRRSGVKSAGCGAAMRSAIIGVAMADDVAARRTAAQAFAEVTHTDPRAVAAAIFVADVAAACALSPQGHFPSLEAELAAAENPSLRTALHKADALARGRTPVAAAAADIGTTGFALHAVPFALFCLRRHPDSPLNAIVEAASAGGDTDTIAAICGGWAGALHGEAALPADLIARLNDGPFGPTHLRGLAKALATRTAPPKWSALAAAARNAYLAPVILTHGFRRLLPPW